MRLRAPAIDGAWSATVLGAARRGSARSASVARVRSRSLRPVGVARTVGRLLIVVAVRLWCCNLSGMDGIPSGIRRCRAKFGRLHAKAGRHRPIFAQHRRPSRQITPTSDNIGPIRPKARHRPILARNRPFWTDREPAKHTPISVKFWRMLVGFGRMTAGACRSSLHSASVLLVLVSSRRQTSGLHWLDLGQTWATYSAGRH